MLEALVASVTGIPRLGTSAAGALNAGPSPSASPATCIPTTSVDEEVVQLASQVKGRPAGTALHGSTSRGAAPIHSSCAPDAPITRTH